MPKSSPSVSLFFFFFRVLFQVRPRPAVENRDAHHHAEHRGEPLQRGEREHAQGGSVVTSRACVLGWASVCRARFVPTG